MNTNFIMPIERHYNQDDISVMEYESALYYENGKLIKPLGPGSHVLRSGTGPTRMAKDLINGLTLGAVKFPQFNTEVIKIDMRMKSLNISGQEMLTLDKVPVRLNLVAQYKVKDAKKAVHESENFLENLYQDLQMSARDYTSSVTLDSLLVNKSEIGDRMMKDVSKKAEKLGIEIVSAGLKDVVLPGEIKEIMARVTAAEKEAKSKLILAREEVASARALANAAKIMATDSNILILKRMELMREISKNPANKVYFGDTIPEENEVKTRKK